MKIETILKIADAIREAEKQNGTLEYSLPKKEYREWLPIEQLNYNEDLYKIILRIRVTEQIKPEPTKRLPTIEEVEKWVLDNKVFKNKGISSLFRINSFSLISNSPIYMYGEWITIDKLCLYYTNYDGSELYITENE